jgi:Ser/Thr protein kinase RdoA (MazF antagonist)
VHAGRRWEMPAVVPALADEAPWLQEGEAFWRMLTYVEGSRTVEVPESAEQARELGQALGTFHALIHDLPVAELADTLEGFHVTPLYLAQYREALAAYAGPVGPELRWAQAFVAQRQELAAVLEQARESGELRLRPIHGDPKVNNVLLDTTSGAAIGLVDLDTVKPGLVQWDIGDCLRSACNPLGEETGDWRAVRFDLALAEALLAGYLEPARLFLEEADFTYLVPAIRLIAFELGLRFLADHLAGDVYFRTSRPGHNLARALVQFRLAESIEAQQADLTELVARLRKARP